MGYSLNEVNSQNFLMYGEILRCGPTTGCFWDTRQFKDQKYLVPYARLLDYSVSGTSGKTSEFMIKIAIFTFQFRKKWYFLP